MAGKIITKLLLFPAKESPNMGSKQFTLTLLHFKTRGLGRGWGVSFFSMFVVILLYCFFSYVPHLSFIYGGN